MSNVNVKDMCVKECHKAPSKIIFTEKTARF